IEIGGQYDHLISSKERLKTVIPLSFGLILLLLYAALRSLKLSIVVFTAVPFAWIGGILALWFTDIPFSISAAVGFIALSGIAVLNGLVLLTSIERKLETHSVYDSIFEGAIERLRPVFMTALVAMLGFLPMALSHSAGSEVQKPLAIVVIGGLFSSTLLTLLILPALTQIVLLFNKKEKNLS
ncbi:MAG: efflux RND transporter permease subunit, partial [Parachlamydiaceae bacterium]